MQMLSEEIKVKNKITVAHINISIDYCRLFQFGM